MWTFRQLFSNVKCLAKFLKTALGYFCLFVMIRIESRRAELIFFQNAVYRPAAPDPLVSSLTHRSSAAVSGRHLCETGSGNRHLRTFPKDSHVLKSSSLKPFEAPDGVISELLGNETLNHSLRSS